MWHDVPDALVDICFVHGLAGNRDKTWSVHGQSTPWPKAFLPPELPRARLITYGYDVYLIGRGGGASTDGLSQHARNLLNDLTNDRAASGASSRPIIFVVHSMGGLVCKEAILVSRNSPEVHLRGIFNHVAGVSFMATPHRGSWVASWGKISASALGVVKSTNASLLDILKTNSQLLESTQERFWSMVRELREGGRQFEVTCFYEELPMPVIGQIVPRTSATMEGYTAISIHANHRDMVKFSSIEETGYKRLLGELTRWEARLEAAQNERERLLNESKGKELESVPDDAPLQITLAPAVPTAQASPCYYIPFSRNKRFVGRKRILGMIWDSFFEQGQRKVAVNGLGGTGKTQIALQFAFRVQEDMPEFSIFWVAAISLASFEQGYVEIGRKLGIYEEGDKRDVKNVVREYLSSKAAGPWLLIVDNADDKDILLGQSDTASSIDASLPENDEGLLLFTTRSRDLGLSLVGNHIIELEAMSPEESFQLLENSLVSKDVLDDKAAAKELLGELVHLPLAITQAAAYLDRNQISIEQYLQLLRETERDMVSLLTRNFRDDTRYTGSENAVATTWVVSFDQIQKSDRVATELLMFMGCVEPKAIPLSILPNVGSKEQMIHAIGTLKGYAFISSREGNIMFDMHRLVHMATQIWAQKEHLDQDAIRAATQHLTVVFPTYRLKDNSIWRAYLPHAARVIRLNSGSEPLKVMKLTMRVASCLMVDARNREAVAYLAQVQIAAQRHLDEAHPELLRLAHHLAVACNNTGDIGRAIQTLEYILKIQRRKGSLEKREEIEIEAKLATFYLNSSENQKASDMLARLEITVAKTKHEANDIFWTETQRQIANAYRRLGAVQKAIPMLEKLTRVSEGLSFNRDLEYLVTLWELASCYLESGRAARAIEILEHAVMIERKMMANDNFWLLQSEWTLARSYLAVGRNLEAVKLLEHCAAVQAKSYLARSSIYWQTQMWLSDAYWKTDQKDQAILLLESAATFLEYSTFRGENLGLLINEKLAERYEQMGWEDQASGVRERIRAGVEIAKEAAAAAQAQQAEQMERRVDEKPAARERIAGPGTEHWWRRLKTSFK